MWARHKYRFVMYVQIKIIINLIFEKKCNLKLLTIKLWNPFSWSCSTFYRTMDKKILCIVVFILLQSLQGKFSYLFQSPRQIKWRALYESMAPQSLGLRTQAKPMKSLLFFSLSKDGSRKIALKWCHSWFRPKNQEISQV